MADKSKVTMKVTEVNGNKVTTISCSVLGILYRLGQAIPQAKGRGLSLVIPKELTKEELQRYINEELNPLAIELVIEG